MKFKNWAIALLCFVSLGFSLGGCRGWTSDQPPIDLNPNMDNQLKYVPYRESEWFKDGRAMRPVVKGTVARGQLREDDHYYTGKVDGEALNTFPKQATLNRESLERGRSQFNIYCAPCHGQTGGGDGLVGRRMPVKPTNLHSDLMLTQPLGHYVDVITNGIRNMPSYRHQIQVEDRWLIAAYIEALQLSQNADPSWFVAKQQRNGK